MSLRHRIAAVTAAVLVASPALAADPASDCTVCRDPMWPALAAPMPGIGLDAPAAADRTGVTGDATWLAAGTHSPGVGVVAAAPTGSVYSDPTCPSWPTLARPAAGIGAPAKAPPAAVASR